MKNLKKRLAVAGAAGALVAGIVAAAAPADANTTGYCWVSPDQAARLSVTRYPYGTGDQIHMDLNSSTPLLGIKYYQANIKLDGTWLNATNDVYRNVGKGTVHTITGLWNVSSGGQVSCSVKSYNS
jgi:hypothetical protein